MIGWILFSALLAFIVGVCVGIKLGVNHARDEIFDRLKRADEYAKKTGAKTFDERVKEKMK